MPQISDHEDNFKARLKIYVGRGDREILQDIMKWLGLPRSFFLEN